ncbi:MAG: autotransporter domain-containing protein, partial [Mailhella sp.]|nr:autotransporter domain-containing protein [Mailhella sp.]
MLTKGAIGNLVNRYKAVLAKCNLINTFGSLAVASMLVLGGAGVAGALEINTTVKPVDITGDSLTVNVGSGQNGIYGEGANCNAIVELNGDLNVNSDANGIYMKAMNDSVAINSTISAKNITVASKTGHGINLWSDCTAKVKPSSFTITAANDMTVTAEASGKNSVLIDDTKGRFVTANITAGGTLTLNGTIRSKNAKALNIDGASVFINGEKNGIYAENGNVNISAAETIDITAGQFGVHSDSDKASGVTGVSVSAKNINIDAAYSLLSQDSGNLAIEATNDVNLTGDILSNSQSEISVGAGNDTTITGNVLASKGQISVESDNNITINGNVESRSGEGAGHLPYVGIKAGGDATINGYLVAHWAEGNSEHAYGLEVEGKNVTVDAGENNVLYNGAGKTNLSASGKLELKGKNGLVNEGGNIGVSAEEVNITAEDFAVLSYSGNTEIAPAKSSNIIGDIQVEDLYGNATPTVKLDLGEGGSLTGAVVNKHSGEGSGVYLDLGKGSAWNATGDSNVTSLKLDDAKLNIADGADIAVTSLDGEGATATIGASAAEDGTVSSGTLTAENSSLKKLAVEYDGVTSDDFASAEKAAEFAKKSVQLGENSDTEVSGAIEAGLVNGAIAIDGEGNATMGKNDVMDAALKQASVTTVALDKILTNDVRKRLGDIRSDKNTTGVWMRWDGGKLQGNGLSNEFNTIQIGGDTKVGKNCRLGVAGTFTHGDAEFARGT